MAKNPKKLHIGQPVARLPAGTINALVEGEYRDRQRHAPPPTPPSESEALVLSLPAVNKTGGPLEERRPIVRLTDPVETPADLADAAQVVLRGLAFECDKPDAETLGRFAVLQSPVAEDAMGEAVVAGLTWAKVDVQAESDTHAEAVEDDVEKLRSGSSGARIVWKQEGTGEKWAVVLLGGGGESEIVCGRLEATVPKRDWIDEGVVIEHWASDGNWYVDDDGDEIGAINRRYYDIRASEEEPISVWGVIRTATVLEGEETVTKRLLEIITADLADVPGFEKDPANDKPQGPFHMPGSREHQQDGSGCAGT